MLNILVTNAASTIGLAITHKMVSNGFHVLAIVNSWDEAKVVSKEGVDPVVLNINKTSSVLKFLKLYGNKIDAAILYVGGFEADQRVIANKPNAPMGKPVNINTWYFFTQALLSFLDHKRHGRIILLGSREPSSIDDALFTGGYSVSNNAMYFLADLINSNKESKIRATVLIPQFFNYPEDELTTNLDRFDIVNPETIAGTIHFLLSKVGVHFIQEIIPVEMNA